jgi:hypothetical protein
MISSLRASAATTPNFAWVSPDDCSDMEAAASRLR